MWREAACVATLALAMSACAPHTRQENFLTAIERGIAECRKDGGTPVQVGHFIHDCEWPATDADKPCTDSDQCQGRCELPAHMSETLEDGVVILRLKPETSAPIVGTCSAFRSRGKPLNCAIHLRDGKLQAETCVE